MCGRIYVEGLGVGVEAGGSKRCEARKRARILTHGTFGQGARLYLACATLKMSATDFASRICAHEAH